MRLRWQRNNCHCRTRTRRTVSWQRPPRFLGLTLLTADERLLGLGEIKTLANC
jgi:hypothetical protein